MQSSERQGVSIVSYVFESMGFAFREQPIIQNLEIEVNRDDITNRVRRRYAGNCQYGVFFSKTMRQSLCKTTSFFATQLV